MSEIDSLVQRREQSGQDVFWQGSASRASISKLESLMGFELPDSFKAFLANCGGGGLAEEEISGIDEDEPTLDYRGTVYGDTMRCHAEYGLPTSLAVIYLNDEVVWCLDLQHMENGECAVVAYDVFAKTLKPIATSFEAFFKQYVNLRTAG